MSQANDVTEYQISKWLILLKQLNFLKQPNLLEQLKYLE